MTCEFWKIVPIAFLSNLIASIFLILRTFSRFLHILYLNHSDNWNHKFVKIKFGKTDQFFLEIFTYITLKLKESKSD